LPAQKLAYGVESAGRASIKRRRSFERAHSLTKSQSTANQHRQREAHLAEGGVDAGVKTSILADWLPRLPPCRATSPRSCAASYSSARRRFACASMVRASACARNTAAISSSWPSSPWRASPLIHEGLPDPGCRHAYCRQSNSEVIAPEPRPVPQAVQLSASVAIHIT
jgi:hypothetical protein